jgi:hypothetical protein
MVRLGIANVGLGTSIVSIGQPNVRRLKITAPSRQLWVEFSKSGWSIIRPSIIMPSALSARVPRIGHVGLKGGGGKNDSCSPMVLLTALILSPSAVRFACRVSASPVLESGRQKHPRYDIC